MRVLGLIPYPLDTAPGQRYRIEQWRPYLEAEGLELTLLPFADSGLSRVLHLRGHYAGKVAGMLRGMARRVTHAWEARRYDAVYLYREAALVGPAWLERLVALRTARIVYDFDDAIWLKYVSPRNRYLSYLKVPSKTGRICGLASAVTVGNDHLASFARRYNSRVTVIPSTVSLKSYRPRPATRDAETPVIVWTGSHSSLQYLRSVEHALRDLALRRRFRLLVIGVPEYRLDGVETTCRDWRRESEVADLWEADLGIMPLRDDPWARGKCAMKAIQYLGIGIPAVVTPVGASRDVVRPGVDGLHAETREEWVIALDRLLSDDTLRRRFGANGRRHVEQCYSAETQAPRFASVLRSMAR